MQAAILRGIKTLEVDEYSLRSLASDEVLVKVLSCGVCRTDHLIFNGEVKVKFPIILGHEYSGIIADVGSKVNEYIAGDKVVIDPNIYCGRCEYCRKGKINFCTNHNALGVTLNGGFSEFSIVPSSQVYKLPSDFNISAATFAEPLSCCIHAINKSRLSAGESVVIIGGGTIGLLMTQLVKLRGASKIILVEPIEAKRNFGLQIGADFSIDPQDKKLDELFRDLLPDGADTVFECVGKEETVSMSFKYIRKGGKLMILGLSGKKDELKINLQKLFYNEISILHSFLNPFTFSAAVDFLVHKKIDVLSLLTNKIQLEEINSIFHQDKFHITKSQITFNNQEAA
ncbi:MAG: zinc-dependent alcohol dehydrogenase family protein [Bacteroidetes bacterium]|nr:zinc-dependent alcohol dehydrogenase family protein [Bacteroidota bacterium]MBU1680259.1 zinc-dependent alcohol dehydrogenase family protein [Bacteroidota bacterium]MBU2505449.1 zinc-dependent alcohol dehydrogenase family protein [Bacteroidota bacterium]